MGNFGVKEKEKKSRESQGIKKWGSIAGNSEWCDESFANDALSTSTVIRMTKRLQTVG